jgi:hypothetical protein
MVCNWDGKSFIDFHVRIPLTPAQYSKMLGSIKRVQEIFRQKGWPLLPLHLYNLHNGETLGV